MIVIEDRKSYDKYNNNQVTILSRISKFPNFTCEIKLLNYLCINTKCTFFLLWYFCDCANKKCKCNESSVLFNTNIFWV